MRPLLLLTLAAAMCARAGTIVIENVSVVDVAAGVVRPPSRVVMEGRTDALINGRGKFLIPGLWDMHARAGSVDRLRGMVERGIVGARDFETPWKSLAAWRDAIERGAIQGPALFGAGEAVDSLGPREARTAFDRLWDLDVDFIGIERGIAREAYIALAEQARHWRLRLAGPLPAGVDAWEAAEARQWSIEGTEGLEKLAGDVWERWTLMGTRLTPLLSAASEKQRETAYRVVKSARKAGVQILAGSGAGASVQQELERLVDAGLSPREALEAATLAPRRLLSARESDVVLLEGNPLEDIRNVGRVVGVVLRGRYYVTPVRR